MPSDCEDCCELVEDMGQEQGVAEDWFRASLAMLEEFDKTAKDRMEDASMSLGAAVGSEVVEPGMEDFLGSRLGDGEGADEGETILSELDGLFTAMDRADESLAEMREKAESVRTMLHDMKDEAWKLDVDKTSSVVCNTLVEGTENKRRVNVVMPKVIAKFQGLQKRRAEGKARRLAPKKLLEGVYKAWTSAAGGDSFNKADVIAKITKVVSREVERVDTAAREAELADAD